MSIRRLAATIVGAALLCAVAAPAAAQAPAGDAKAEISGGVDLGNWVRNRGVVNRYKSGWFVTASARVTHLISLVGEFSGDYRKADGFTHNIYAYSGGAKFGSTGDERVRPFAVIMLGGAQDNGDNSGKINHYPVVTPGGGVDLGLSSGAAVRVKVDFPLYSTFGDVYKGARVGVGLVVRFR